MPSRETLSLLEELLSSSSKEDDENSNLGKDEDKSDSDEEDYFYPAHPVDSSGKSTCTGARTAKTNLEKNVLCKVVYSQIDYGYDTDAYSNRIATFAANMIGVKRENYNNSGSSDSSNGSGSGNGSGGSVDVRCSSCDGRGGICDGSGGSCDGGDGKGRGKKKVMNGKKNKKVKVEKKVKEIVTLNDFGL